MVLRRRTPLGGVALTLFDGRWWQMNCKTAELQVEVTSEPHIDERTHRLRRRIELQQTGGD